MIDRESGKQRANEIGAGPDHARIAEVARTLMRFAQKTHEVVGDFNRDAELCCTDLAPPGGRKGASRDDETYLDSARCAHRTGSNAQSSAPNPSCAA